MSSSLDNKKVNLLVESVEMNGDDEITMVVNVVSGSPELKPGEGGAKPQSTSNYLSPKERRFLRIPYSTERSVRLASSNIGRREADIEASQRNQRLQQKQLAAKADKKQMLDDLRRPDNRWKDDENEYFLKFEDDRVEISAGFENVMSGEFNDRKLIITIDTLGVNGMRLGFEVDMTGHFDKNGNITWKDVPGGNPNMSTIWTCISRAG